MDRWRAHDLQHRIERARQASASAFGHRLGSCEGFGAGGASVTALGDRRRIW
jgi:hypothetical protein